MAFSTPPHQERCIPKAFPSGGCRPASRHLATPGGDPGDTGDSSFPLPAGGRKKNTAGGPAAAAGWQQHPAGALPQGAGSGMQGGSLKRKGASLLGGGFSSAAPSPRALSCCRAALGVGTRGKRGVKGQHPCPRDPPVGANARSRLNSCVLFFISGGGSYNGIVIPITPGWACRQNQAG